jgi:hypothetical protein
MSTEQHAITVLGLPVEIVRKNIKNLHLGVYPPTGRVRVAAPLRISNDAVRLAVIGKLGWIKRQQARFERQPRESAREMISGESHYFLGRRYGSSEQPSILRRGGNSRPVQTSNLPRISCSFSGIPLFTRLSETLRPRHCQPIAVQIQVHQREAGAQPLMVLLNPSVSHLLETEDALQNPEGMFHLRSHSGLYPVLGFL